MNAFGGRLEQLRNEAGISREELARRSRLNPKAISKAEAGEMDPRLTQVEAIAQGLGVTLAEFIAGL